MDVPKMVICFFKDKCSKECLHKVPHKETFACFQICRANGEEIRGVCIDYVDVDFNLSDELFKIT